MIREAEFGDWNQLAELIEKSNKEMAERHNVPDFTRAHLAVVFNALRTTGGIFVADEDGILIGYVAWVSSLEGPPGVVEGMGTYVLPEYRRKGTSVALRGAAYNFHKARGAKRIYGVAHDGNEAGLKSSIEEGFKVVGKLVCKEIE